MVKNLFAGFGLALGVGACTALFADHTGEAPPVAGDGGKLPDGAMVDGEVPKLVKCDESGAGCAATLVGRSFPRDDIAEGKYIVHNVAIAVANKQVYAAVQGKSSSGDGFANKGQSSWGRWPTDIGALPVASVVFSNRELCANNSKCLGPLHLLSTGSDVGASSNVVASFATGQCSGSLGRQALDNSPQAGDGCFPKSITMQDGWSARANEGSIWLTGSWVAFEPDASALRMTNAEASDGLWAGFANGAFLAVYYDKRYKQLARAESSGGATLARLLGPRVSFPDVAKRDESKTAYIAGVGTDNQYTLVARNWDSGQDVTNALPPISFFGLQTYTASAQDGDDRPFRPLRVLVDTHDKLRLVALSREGQATNTCNLYAFVQTAADAKIWNRHVLVSAAPCSAISFDAALDASDSLHVIYGKQDINVGYAVISP